MAVIVVIALLTTLIGVLLVVHHAQYQFIRRDAHRTQARYVAEAGVFTVLDSLRQHSRWRPQSQELELPFGGNATVSVEPFGGFLLVRSVARVQRSRCVLRAWVGEVPPEPFEYAVYDWDMSSVLSLAGRTQIVGDVMINTRGVREEPLEGRAFTGSRVGAVDRRTPVDPPYFDAHVFAETLDMLDSLVIAADIARTPENSLGERAAARQMPSENPVWARLGDAVLTPADSALLARPTTIVATGDLRLLGPLHYADGTVFIAGGSLFVRGRLTGTGAVFYGRAGVDVGGGTTGSGQFLSRTSVHVRAGAYLYYPSVLFVTGEGMAAGGRIELEDSTVVDGSIVHALYDPPPPVPRGRVVVQKSARVRGAIYNAHETEMRGTLYGSLLTHELYFMTRRSSYTNWLLDAVIDLSARPATYAVPVGFSREPHLDVLSWAHHIDEVEIHDTE